MSYKPTTTDLQTLVQLSAAQSPPIDPVQVALVLFEESTFNPSVQNAGGAPNYGLNQMSATNIAGLGLTVSEWTSMTAAEQLPYVFKWWAKQAAYANNGQFFSDAGQLLALNLGQVAYKNVNAGSNPDAVLAGKSGPYANSYAGNPQLGNGAIITVNTCRAYLAKIAGGSSFGVLARQIEQVEGVPSVSPQSTPSNPVQSFVTSLLGGLLLGGTAFIVTQEIERYRRPASRRKRRRAA